MDDARLWIEGGGVYKVTIVKFEESPPYRSPRLFNDDGEELSPEELGIPEDRFTILEDDFALGGQFGPATYRNLTWVGHISQVLMEHWVPDANGKAVRDGNSEDLCKLVKSKYPSEISYPLVFPRRFL